MIRLITSVFMSVFILSYASYSYANDAMIVLVNDAERGDIDAQYELGVKYQFGDEVQINYQKAIEWYGKSAHQNNFLAQYRLGYFYDEFGLGGIYDEYGNGVEKNTETAKSWYLKSAVQGYMLAQFGLANIYRNVVGNGDANAFMWYEKAAKQGYFQALGNLGIMYENGDFVSQNYKKAHMFYNLAARSGDHFYKRQRKQIETKLTSSQIIDAQDMAEDWINNHKP